MTPILIFIFHFCFHFCFHKQKFGFINRVVESIYIVKRFKRSRFKALATFFKNYISNVMFYILLFVFRIITISFSNSILPESLHENLGSCSSTCNHLWDGFGQWKNNQWKPYLQGQYATYCIFHIQFRGEKYGRFQCVEFMI